MIQQAYNDTKCDQRGMLNAYGTSIRKSIYDFSYL